MTPKRKISKPVKIKKFLSGGTPVQQIIKQTGLSESRISQIKTKLQKQGIQIPKYSKTNWKDSKGNIYKQVRARKALITNPTKQTIKEYTKQLNFNTSTIQNAIKQIKKENRELIRKGIMPLEIQVKSGYLKPIPKLTKKQQAVLQQAQPFVRQAVNRLSFKHKFNTETKQDFQAEVQRQLPNIIKKFKPEKSQLNSWITQKIYRINQEFNITREKQKTGLSTIETKIGKKLETFIQKQTNILEQQQKRKITYQQTQKILLQAIKELNNTKHYAKRMKKNYKKRFPKRKLTLKEATEILNARNTRNTQQNTEDRRGL